MNRSFFVPAALVMSCLSTLGQAEPMQGPGVFAFNGKQPTAFCLGSSQSACGKIALADADSRAEILQDSHEIRLSSQGDYRNKTLFADVFIPATGKSEAGAMVPLMLHVKISKSRNNEYTTSMHSHAPVRGKFQNVTTIPWKITVDQQPVLSAEAMHDALTDPAMAARMASAFVQVDDNRTTSDAAPDITVRMGLGKLAMPVMHSRLVAPTTHSQAELEALLQNGTWSLTLDARSGLIPKTVTRHELFLYGLDKNPLLAGIMKKGLDKGDRIVVGAKEGKGYLQLGNQTAALSNAGEIAAHYIDSSFIGLILAWQQVNPG